MVGVSLWHIITDDASILGSIIGLCVGIGLGFIVARMVKITWDEQIEQVIGTFDAVGIVILILYILFEINREKIVAHFVGDASILAVSFAVLAGIMYGRVLGIRGKIKKVFTEQDIS
jgi:hypothetical protein